MINKISRILMLAGIGICLWYVGYRGYLTAAERAVALMKATGTETVPLLAGLVLIAEGEVEHADDGWTAIRYYHEWDGAEYRHIIKYVSEEYPEKAYIPVIYSLGMGPGSCLAVGFYRKRMLIMGVTGLFMTILGWLLIIFNQRKERRKWQEEKLLPETGR